MESEAGLKQQLEDLQKQLGKKQRFEDSVSKINFLLRDRFTSASPALRNLVSLFLYAFFSYDDFKDQNLKL